MKLGSHKPSTTAAGEVIRQVRIDCGLTQQELADRVPGVHAPNISSYETGDTVPSYDKVKRILDACGYDLWALPR